MHRHITPGLYIDGLLHLCGEQSLNVGETQPREAGILGNWSFERNLLSANVLSFVANTGDVANRVKILPYLKQGTSYTASDNCPVISGPFSGCIMRGFKKDGVLHVAHVNRTDASTNTRLDTEWGTFGASETQDHATGTDLSDWLVPKITEEKKYKAAEMNNFGIWVIAMPGADGWRFYEFLVHNKPDGRMKVKKVYW